jgi:hypothetical protein
VKNGNSKLVGKENIIEKQMLGGFLRGRRDKKWKKNKGRIQR